MSVEMTTQLFFLLLITTNHTDASSFTVLESSSLLIKYYQCLECGIHFASI